MTNLYCSEPTAGSTYLEPDVIETAKLELISIISECNFDTQRIAELFYRKEWQQDKVKLFLNLLEKNKSVVLYAAFNHYNSSYCNTIVNFDWIVKYVLGTSELKTFKCPLLQLMLFTLNKKGKQNKLMYDINKDTLLKMINVLQNIQ